MEIVRTWSLQVMMLMLMATGAMLKSRGILGDRDRATLTDLIMDFILPCNIINSFNVSMDMDTLKKFALLLAIAIAIQVFCYILGSVLYVNKPSEVAAIMKYCTIVSNSGFIGLPVAQGIFGAEGLMYASIFIIPQRIVIWSAGIACFTDSPSMKDVIKKVALHPCIIAVYIGVAYMFLREPAGALYSAYAAAPGMLVIVTDVISASVGKFVTTAASGTTALTMILIGMMLSGITPRDAADSNVAFITVMRLILLPLLVYICCTIAGLDPLIKGVAVVITGMPAGSTAPILAAKYGRDYTFASRCVVVSTVLSMISIPIWCMFL